MNTMLSATSDDSDGNLPSASMQDYHSLFINRTDIWFRQWSDGERCGYACVKPDSKSYEPIRDSLILRHLEGTVTCSWPAVDQAGLSRWACWDSDHENGYIVRLQQLLACWGMQSYREAVRPGRDGHLWLFLAEPIAAADLLLFNLEALAHAGIAIDAVEFFPKSADRLSQVRGPLGIHRKPGADNMRGWFESAPKSLECQLAFLSSIERVKVAPIQRLAAYRKSVVNQSTQRQYPRQIKTSPLHDSFRISDHIDLNLCKRVGQDLAAPCPACQAEGRDRTGDNLRISPNGRFCCVQGGPGKVHRQRDIRRALILGL